MHLGSGKNSKLCYYLGCLRREAVPGVWLRWRLKRVLARARRRKDWEYIERRVNYYCRLNAPVALPADSPRLGEHTREGMASVYYFDTREFIRWFDPQLRWRLCPGDVTYVPEWPSVVKSRPIAAEGEEVICVGMCKGLSQGESISAQGEYIDHPASGAIYGALLRERNLRLRHYFVGRRLPGGVDETQNLAVGTFEI